MYHRLVNAGNKRRAQQRADRIRAFREELAELERENVLALSEEQRTRLNDYLDSTLKDLAACFDIDVTESQKQISWGMRIASTLGGLALCAAVVLFFYRFWGLISVPVQIAILALAPLAALAAVEFAARKERTLYYASLLSVVAFAGFVLNLNALGSIFQIRPSPHALLAWGLFELAIAYKYGLRLPLAAGLVCLVSYAAALIVAWSGGWWLSFFERPESYLIGGLLVVGMPNLAKRRMPPEFAWVYRLIGLSVVFIALFMLSNSGRLSYLSLTPKKTELLYQVASLAAAVLAIRLGISHGLAAAVNLGALFFTISLFARFEDWWWDWMPKYLFFFLIGTIAIALLAVFRRLRARMQA